MHHKIITSTTVVVALCMLYFLWTPPALQYIIPLDDDDTTTKVVVDDKHMFIFFLGEDETRINITLNNLQIPSNCIVLTHATYNVAMETQITKRGCSVTWLHKYNLAQKMKHLDPSLLKPFKTMTIVLDDVDIKSMNWSHYLTQINDDEDIISPTVINSWQPFMQPNKSCLSGVRSINYLEPQAITFTSIKAWEAWYVLTDLRFPHGMVETWVDLYTPGLKMTLYDSHHVRHHVELGTSRTPADNSFIAQIKTWQKERGKYLWRLPTILQNCK